MRFVQPMLASGMSDKIIIEPNEFVAEEKFDGHRLIVAVCEGQSLFGNAVEAWSRNAIERLLPPHIRTALETMPPGVYDGELIVPGMRSFGVTELTNSKELVYTVFDVIELLGRVLLMQPYQERREFLDEIFRARPDLQGSVNLASTVNIESESQVKLLSKSVWARDGEGLILKRRNSIYQPGKRNRDWVKIKQLRSAVLTVIGYREGRLGPQAILVLRDDEGYETTVKTLNDFERYRLGQNPEAYIGKKLAIEYQERTVDGSFRHPRMDHWVEE